MVTNLLSIVSWNPDMCVTVLRLCDEEDKEKGGIRESHHCWWKRRGSFGCSAPAPPRREGGDRRLRKGRLHQFRQLWASLSHRQCHYRSQPAACPDTCVDEGAVQYRPVSYTHLTLPTIY